MAIYVCLLADRYNPQTTLSDALDDLVRTPSFGIAHNFSCLYVKYNILVCVLLLSNESARSFVEYNLNYKQILKLFGKQWFVICMMCELVEQ